MFRSQKNNHIAYSQPHRALPGAAFLIHLSQYLLYLIKETR